MPLPPAPEYVFTQSNGVGTRSLFARWPNPPADVGDAAEEFARRFHGAGARFFVLWEGDDGAFYGIARARNKPPHDGPLAI